MKTYEDKYDEAINSLVVAITNKLDTGIDLNSQVNEIKNRIDGKCSCKCERIVYDIPKPKTSIKEIILASGDPDSAIEAIEWFVNSVIRSNFDDYSKWLSLDHAAFKDKHNEYLIITELNTGIKGAIVNE